MRRKKFLSKLENQKNQIRSYLNVSILKLFGYVELFCSYYLLSFVIINLSPGLIIQLRTRTSFFSVVVIEFKYWSQLSVALQVPLNPC